MEEKNISSTSGIKMKDKFGYAMGDVASLLVFGLVNTFLQVFYTDALGITPLIVMLIMIVARVWDAINDPLWGRVVDRANCKKPGTRYKRWLLILAIPVAISAVLMFLNVKELFPSWTNGAIIAYAAISYILFSMLYTGTNIPYGSLASVITSDDKERNALSVFRSVGSTLGGFGPMILSFLVYDQGKLLPNKLFFGVIILAVLSIVFYAICYFTSKERVVAPPIVQEKGATKKALRGLFKTKSFVIISIVGMLFLAAQMFQTTYNTYVFKSFFNNGGLAAVTQIFQYLPVAIIMFLSGKLVNKFGRKEICAFGLLFTGISFAVLALLSIFIIDNRTILMYLFFAFSLLGGIGNSFIFLMIWALANDAVDDYFVRSKSHDEATAYSIFTFMRKLGQTVAAIIVNISLISLGYGTDAFEVNAANASTGMYFQSLVIPSVLSLIMFALLMFVYPLSKNRVIELQKEKQVVLDAEKEVN
ncbi:MAG: glycoside-pentoside-hexuronide (GPH):cation symporter [Bacillales bacterium]|nr:glycoside-pentoside-hexuronide (GPH):cation symporter [Bacillales bacterium]